MTPTPIIATLDPDGSTMLPHLEVDPFGVEAHADHDEAAEPGAGAWVGFAVDRIERHYTKRPAMDDVGVFGSGPLSGRAPDAFEAFGPEPQADGLPTTVVLDGPRWSSHESDDHWV